MTIEETHAALRVYGNDQRERGAKAKDDGDDDAATRHTQRADHADRGLLLHDTEEQRDPHHCMRTQELRSAAFRHGLVRPRPKGEE
jgi:hypothetical protein